MVFWERLRNPYPPGIGSLFHDSETPRRDPLFRLRGLVSVFTGTGPLRRLGRMGADPAQTPCQLSHLREGYGGDKEGGQGETRELIRRKGTPRIFSSIRRNRWPISQPHRHRPVHTDPVPRDPAPAGEHLHPRCRGVAQCSPEEGIPAIVRRQDPAIRPLDHEEDRGPHPLRHTPGQVPQVTPTPFGRGVGGRGQLPPPPGYRTSLPAGIPFHPSLQGADQSASQGTGTLSGRLPDHGARG